MARQYQLPGGQYLNETASNEYQLPGGPFVNETVAAAGGGVFIPIVGRGPGMSLADVGGGLAGARHA